MKKLILCLVLVVAGCGRVSSHRHYVEVDGSSSGAGVFGEPCYQERFSTQDGKIIPLSWDIIPCPKEDIISVNELRFFRREEKAGKCDCSSPSCLECTGGEFHDEGGPDGCYCLNEKKPQLPEPGDTVCVHQDGSGKIIMEPQLPEEIPCMFNVDESKKNQDGINCERINQLIRYLKARE